MSQNGKTSRWKYSREKSWKLCDKQELLRIQNAWIIKKKLINWNSWKLKTFQIIQLILYIEEDNEKVIKVLEENNCTTAFWHRLVYKTHQEFLQFNN